MCIVLFTIHTCILCIYNVHVSTDSGDGISAYKEL